MVNPVKTQSDSEERYGRSLRALYFIRFIFAAIWVASMVVTAAKVPDVSPLLTVLLVIYPAFDAAAVLWQLRADPDRHRSKVVEWVNVVLSVAVAVALGFASSASISAVLAIWGVWAIVVGVPQLIAAIRNRYSGGQVAQMFSGSISVFAGAGFLLQGLQGSDMIVGVAGYAGLGAVFFLVSAVRLTVMPKKSGT
ncbi:DUF308 domain-containing protein [Brevibacterium oceani]|uniref:DUF308 domain-containing protein n=1 Tax=Brevibacterium oceani TaxID=358099 RepID=UPI001B326C4E|nr:DUF308 domain-containing protein [Brevibacterium oceani]